RVVAYPSLYEGFGLPVLEAMACGAPVVTSRGGASEEVAGDAAVLVDPLDPAAIAAGLEEAIGRRDELQLKGLARALAYSWDRVGWPDGRDGARPLVRARAECDGAAASSDLQARRAAGREARPARDRRLRADEARPRRALRRPGGEDRGHAPRRRPGVRAGRQ